MRVLTIYDIPGWAYHRNCLGLAKHLGWTAVSQDTFQSNWKDLYNSYDAFVSWVPLFTSDLPVCDKLWCMVGSHSYGVREDWRECFRKCRGVLTISKRLWEEIGNRGCESELVHQGVDTDVFTIAPDRGKPNLIGWCGSRRTEKCYEEVEAIRGVIPGYRIEDIYVEPRKALYPPHRMTEYYNRLAVFLCTSRQEGGPLTMLEAMACGVPVVSTPVGMAPEVITGSNGRIATTTEERISALIDLVSLPLSRQGIRQAILDNWSWEKIAPNYERAVCGKSPS